MKEILNKEVEYLRLDKKIQNILSNKKVHTICELCNYSRMELVELGLTNNQISEVISNLQLQGLDLKPNHAKKNNILVNKYFL